jgi:hypothetical protein
MTSRDTYWLCVGLAVGGMIGAAFGASALLAVLLLEGGL